MDFGKTYCMVQVEPGKKVKCEFISHAGPYRVKFRHPDGREEAIAKTLVEFL